MRMLVCTDGSEQSKKALKEACRFAHNFKDVDVSILTVFQATYIPMDGVYGGSVSGDIQDQLEKAKINEGEEILKDAAKIFADENISHKTILKKGHPSDAIVTEAEEGKYDLIVLGSRGLGGLKRLLLGSVSNAVVQEVKTNVLIIK